MLRLHFRTTGGTVTDQIIQSNSGMFANLSGYKRDPANPAFQARRASVADQATQKSSVIGGLFNKFVRGEHPAGNK